MIQTSPRIESNTSARSGSVFGASLTAAFAIVTGCAGQPPASDAASSRLTDDDYAVMSTVVRHILADEPFAGPLRSRELRRPIEQVVIISEADPEAPARIGPVQPESGPPMDTTTGLDYSRKTDRPAFERRFTGLGAYELLSLDEMQQIFEAGSRDGWADFYSRFPGAPGFFALSRVGFNSDRTEALVHFIHLRDGTCCRTGAFLLRRQADTWSVAGYQQLREF